MIIALKIIVATIDILVKPHEELEQGQLNTEKKYLENRQKNCNEYQSKKIFYLYNILVIPIYKG